MQPAFAVSGASFFMLNSIAKVSHDLPPGAAQGIRGSRRRGVHDAVRDLAHDAAHPPAWPGGRRHDPFRCGDRFPRLLRARRAEAEESDHRIGRDRKSTRLNSSHRCISYAVFCLKKKKIYMTTT